MIKPRYRKLEIGCCYRSTNPDDTYMYFEVISIEKQYFHDEMSVKIKVHEDDDSVYARAFRKGAEVYLPRWGNIFSVGNCKRITDSELLAVII